MKLTVVSLVVVFALLVLQTPLHADTVTVSYQDSGWYAVDGVYGSTQNYVSDNLPSVNFFHHNFFVFDLTGVNTPVSAGVLRLFNGTFSCFVGCDGATSLTYTVYDVSTPVNTLLSHPSPSVSIFNDLASGTVFGSVVISAADNNSVVSINLNSAGVAAINAALGSKIAFGGNVDRGSTFLGTGQSGDTRQLVLTTGAAAPVPEPSSLCYLTVALGALALQRKYLRRI